MCQYCDRRAFLGAGLAAALSTLVGCGGRQPTARKALRYTVEVGDTLASISHRSGASIGTIITANSLRSRELFPGQVLWLPGVSSVRPTDQELPEPKPRTHFYDYRIVHRSEWGAADMRAGEYDPMGVPNRVTLHHTGDIPGMVGRSDAELVKAVQRNHQNLNGWADIGYHYLVGHNGIVYEGRPVFAQGAHAGGDNNKWNIGVSVIGDFNHRLPDEQQLHTLKEFIGVLERRYNVPKTRVYGHREFKTTVCPGNALYSWLQQYRGVAPQVIRNAGHQTYRAS